MAMVGVDSGSLYRRTHSLSRLAWSWVGGRLAPFYIHQMNRVNSRNGSACHDDSTINIVLVIIIIVINIIIITVIINITPPRQVELCFRSFCHSLCEKNNSQYGIVEFHVPLDTL